VRNEPALQQKLATVQTESLRGLARWLLLAIALALIVYYLILAA
jgi:hypothetical protein